MTMWQDLRLDLLKATICAPLRPPTTRKPLLDRGMKNATHDHMTYLNVAKFCLLSAIIASAAGLAACGGQHDAQSQADRGNASVQRMSVLRAEIASKTGIDVTIGYTEEHVTVRTMDRSRLIIARDLIAEYIEHGEDILRIASRDDVNYPSKVPMSRLVKLAKNTQTLIELRLASMEERQERPDEHRQGASPRNGRRAPPGTQNDGTPLLRDDNGNPQTPTSRPRQRPVVPLT